MFQKLKKYISLGIESLSEAAQTITPFIDKRLKERIKNIELMYGIMRGQWLIFILALGIIALCTLLCVVWNKDDMACTIWWGSIFVFYGLWIPKVFRDVLRSEGVLRGNSGDSVKEKEEVTETENKETEIEN